MNQSTWDILITISVLLILGLLVWSRVSGMTIPELIRQIKDVFQDKGEEITTEAMVWNE